MIQFLVENYQTFCSGIGITLSLVTLSLGIGFAFALLFVYLIETGKWYFKLPIEGWIQFSRGVPLLVQIFLLYYGAPQFEWIRKSIIWGLIQEPFMCTLIILSFSTAAYTAVILRGAVQAIPKGEMEACTALQMNYFIRMRHVVLKRALISFWPSYANEMIILLKSTALASTITLMDLTGVMRQVIAKTYEPTTALLIAAILYLLFSTMLLSIHQQIKRYCLLPIYKNRSDLSGKKYSQPAH